MSTLDTNCKICQVIDCINEDTGGTAYTVAHLASNLIDIGLKAEIVTFDRTERGPQITLPNISVVPADSKKGFAEELEQVLNSGTQLIHNHGIWLYANYCARQYALKHECPLLISPRGMLESWSLSRGKLKKFIAWHLFEKRNLLSATAFHATAISEAESIRRLGFKQPIAVIPNGISMPDESPPELSLLSNEIQNSRVLLFMSRIHPKKGIENLLDAWRALSSEFTDWQLVIAGPGEEDYVAAITKRAADLKRVTLLGLVRGETKESLLKHASLFVLPTFSENFGNVVGESLAHGTPVITTKGAPWEVLEKKECGWWIDIGLQPLIETLKTAMSLTLEDLAKRGRSGRSHVSAELSHQRVAEDMARVYRWIIEGGEAPEFVQFAEIRSNRCD